MRTTSGASVKLDICDDSTSGYMQGYCAKHENDMAKIKRNSDLSVLQQNWTAAEKVAFKKLQAASNEFTQSRSTEEVDQSGTARAMFVISEEAMQQKDFIQSLELLEKNKAPRYSIKQLEKEDAKLNALYGVIQSKKADEMIYGTVTPASIKTTQRAWVHYRDAWVEFAKIKYPNYTADSIAAWFTKKRNHMLSSFLG
jgi:uncharacterized protein YecT (DUF1311 family)